MLVTSLVFEGLAATMVAIIGANLGSQVLLWTIAGLYGVRSTINGSQVVWNSTYLTIVFLQVAVLMGLIGLTFFAQSRKTRFI